MSQASIESTGVSRGSLKSYLTGFGLSLILTAIPFALVMSGILSFSTTLAGIAAAGEVKQALISRLLIVIIEKLAP